MEICLADLLERETGGFNEAMTFRSWKLVLFRAIRP